MDCRVNRLVGQVAKRLLMLFVPVCLAVFGGVAWAADPIEIHIKDNRFHPAVVEVPAGQKVKLIIYNDGDEAEEFESFELNREKIIRAGRKATIFLPPLEPGEYPFFGEFHPETAQGKVVAK